MPVIPDMHVQVGFYLVHVRRDPGGGIGTPFPVVAYAAHLDKPDPGVLPVPFANTR